MSSGGARPPVQQMISFIEEYREVYGVDPVCRVLPVSDNLLRACRSRSQPRQGLGSVQTGRRNSRDDQARPRRKQRSLQSAQNLATASEGEERSRAPHHGMTHAG